MMNLPETKVPGVVANLAVGLLIGFGAFVLFIVIVFSAMLIGK